MGKLKTLPDRIGKLPPLLGSLGGGSRPTETQRTAATPWRAWYKTARWQRLRFAILARDLFTCQRCGKLEVDTSQLVADHREPHRGSAALFWDANNLQCLCKPCHDRDKQRDERGGGA